jgi:hypothetical protein
VEMYWIGSGSGPVLIVQKYCLLLFSATTQLPNQDVSGDDPLTRTHLGAAQTLKNVFCALFIHNQSLQNRIPILCLCVIHPSSSIHLSFSQKR